MEAVLRAEPSVALRNVTSEMSDHDLIGAVTTFTDFSDDDFRGIRDVRTYVNRLAAVALAGVWTPGVDAEAPLDPAFQRAFSEFSYLSSAELVAGAKTLRKAIEDGSVRQEIEACEASSSVFQDPVSLQRDRPDTPAR